MPYHKSECPVCGNLNFVNIKQKIVEHYENGHLVGTDFMDAELKETVSADKLVDDILSSLAEHLYNGITIKKLCKMLHDIYGIVEDFCCDMIQKIKYELCMYCPDRCHLYFVDEEVEQEIKGV